MNDCMNCKYGHKTHYEEPCVYCDNGSKWKPKNNSGQLEELKENVSKAIHNFPLIVNPCDVCKYHKRQNSEELEVCHQCCYYYGSKFEMEQ